MNRNMILKLVFAVAFMALMNALAASLMFNAYLREGEGYQLFWGVVNAWICVGLIKDNNWTIKKYLRS